MPSKTCGSADGTSGTRSNAPLERAPHPHLGVAGLEADQLRLDLLIGAARHGGGAGRHLDPVRRRRFALR